MSTYATLGRRLGHITTTHRWKVIFAALAIFVVGVFGVTRARFSTDYRVFFSHDDPGLAKFEELERTFTKTDNVLFVLHAPRDAEGAFSIEALSAQQELTAAALTLPFAARVDSLPSSQDVRTTADDVVIAPYVTKPAQELTKADRDELRVRVMNSLLPGSLVSHDGSTAAVNVTLRLLGREPDEVSKSADAARALAREVNARHPSLDIRPCGMAFVNDAFMQASVGDLAVMMPLMLAVIFLAMALVLRSATSTMAVAVIIGASAALAMACAGWAGYPLTPPAVAAPMIVLTVAVADGVHIALAVAHALARGESKQAAIVSSLGDNLEAVTYTWLTTVVGFLCLNFSDAPPVTHLANMTCVGVTAAYVGSITLLPALLTFARVKPRALAAEGTHAPGRVTQWLTDLVVTRRRSILLATALGTVLCGGLMSRLEMNDQFVKYFAPQTEFRKNADFTLAHLSGIYRLEYLLGSSVPPLRSGQGAGEAGGATDPKYLEASDRFATWLRSEPEVDHVLAFSDMMKTVHAAMRAPGDTSALPTSREEAAQELLAYEMNLPAGVDLRDRIDQSRGSTRLTVTVKDLSTREMNAFAQRTSSWLREHAPPAMWTDPTGPVVIFSALSERNARSMIQGDIASLLLITLCMILVLRSLGLGLASVVPNVIPVVAGYGLWRVAVGQMNIVATVAGSIALGIIVDDTIHFLTRYRTLRERGVVPEEAMRSTLRHVAPAMISTTAILVAGFLVLTRSHFQMTSHLGWLTALIVGIAPLGDLLIAPSLVLATEDLRARLAELRIFHRKVLP